MRLGTREDKGGRSAIKNGNTLLRVQGEADGSAARIYRPRSDRIRLVGGGRCRHCNLLFASGTFARQLGGIAAE